MTSRDVLLLFLLFTRNKPKVGASYPYVMALSVANHVLSCVKQRIETNGEGKEGNPGSTCQRILSAISPSFESDCEYCRNVEELSAISSPSFPSSSLSDPVTSMLIEETQKGVQIYRSLNSIVDDFSIHDVWQLKPLLNGNIIRKVFLVIIAFSLPPTHVHLNFFSPIAPTSLDVLEHPRWTEYVGINARTGFMLTTHCTRLLTTRYLLYHSLLIIQFIHSSDPLDD